MKVLLSFRVTSCDFGIVLLLFLNCADNGSYLSDEVLTKRVKVAMVFEVLVAMSFFTAALVTSFKSATGPPDTSQQASQFLQ